MEGCVLEGYSSASRKTCKEVITGGGKGGREC